MGAGGREHALAWKLSQEAEVFACPGNPGISQVAQCFPIRTNDISGLRILSKSLQPDLILIGPEDPLISGLADDLRSDKFAVFGPGEAGALVEGSKAYSKGLMDRARVPTAKYRSFTSPQEAKRYARETVDGSKGAVIKASGAALGKGVMLCHSAEECDEGIDDLMVKQSLGKAGSIVVVEEMLEGPELSLMTIVGDEGTLTLPVAQDYKRALDHDRGPNTGGMGSVSAPSWVSESLVARTEAEIVRPILDQLRAEGVEYRGVLFSGVLVQDGKPYCLEYNVRFGDPETQSIMLRIGSGLGQALLSAANGSEPSPVEIIDGVAVSVVLASGGYPGAYERGKAISLPEGIGNNVQIFHAGTEVVNGQLSTAGGRVLCVSALGKSQPEARRAAMAVCEEIRFEGAHYRKDIALEQISAHR